MSRCPAAVDVVCAAPFVGLVLLEARTSTSYSPPSHRWQRGCFGSSACSLGSSFASAGGGSTQAWQREREQPGCMRSWPRSTLDGFPPSLSLEQFKEPQALTYCQFRRLWLPACKHPVKSGAPHQRSGPGLREGGKAPPLLRHPGVALPVVNWAIVHLSIKRFFFVRAPSSIKMVARKVGK
jgi:hypothetical protein